MQDCLLHLFSLEGSYIFLTEIFILDLRFRLDNHAKHFTLLSSIYGSYFATDRRNKLDLRAVLIDHQYRTGFDFFSYFGNNFGYNTVIIIGNDSVTIAFPSV